MRTVDETNQNDPQVIAQQQRNVLDKVFGTVYKDPLVRSAASPMIYGEPLPSSYNPYFGVPERKTDTGWQNDLYYAASYANDISTRLFYDWGGEISFGEGPSKNYTAEDFFADKSNKSIILSSPGGHLVYDNWLAGKYRGVRNYDQLMNRFAYDMTRGQALTALAQASGKERTFYGMLAGLGDPVTTAAYAVAGGVVGIGAKLTGTAIVPVTASVTRSLGGIATENFIGGLAAQTTQQLINEDKTADDFFVGLAADTIVGSVLTGGFRYKSIKRASYLNKLASGLEETGKLSVNRFDRTGSLYFSGQQIAGQADQQAQLLAQAMSDEFGVPVTAFYSPERRGYGFYNAETKQSLNQEDLLNFIKRPDNAQVYKSINAQRNQAEERIQKLKNMLGDKADQYKKQLDNAFQQELDAWNALDPATQDSTPFPTRAKTAARLSNENKQKLFEVMGEQQKRLVKWDPDKGELTIEYFVENPTQGRVVLSSTVYTAEGNAWRNVQIAKHKDIKLKQTRRTNFDSNTGAEVSLPPNDITITLNQITDEPIDNLIKGLLSPEGKGSAFEGNPDIVGADSGVDDFVKSTVDEFVGKTSAKGLYSNPLRYIGEFVNTAMDNVFELIGEKYFGSSKASPRNFKQKLRYIKRLWRQEGAGSITDEAIDAELSANNNELRRIANTFAYTKIAASFSLWGLGVFYGWKHGLRGFIQEQLGISELQGKGKDRDPYDFMVGNRIDLVSRHMNNDE